MITKEEIRNSLPHGSFKKIAEKANVTTNAVSRFFADKIKSSQKIEKAALEVAIEYQRENGSLVNELKSLS